jgi:hypothetical protein
MTKKADFNAEEWSRVLAGPPVAGLIVMVAEKGGRLRESISMGRAYSEAQKEHGGTELVREIVSATPEIDRARFQSPEQVRAEGPQVLRESVQLLESKATADEVAEYKRFVTTVAETVANAKKEGGVLGIGGKPVSDAEQTALNEITEALGTEPPSTG